eukprot:TRINITY_DN43684_c0_g1_i1.p1 TRINITY_DN43684_c0_g1~~TRINITY_DN43684_c0_g1_i1.p1  ORF type:complete len:397 (-),score=69.80 TRINITY_DN43684_c0_g1_i1:24-1214(-)
MHVETSTDESGELLLSILGAATGDPVASLLVPEAADVRVVKKELAKLCGVPLHTRRLLGQKGEALIDLHLISSLPVPRKLQLLRLPFNDHAGTRLLELVASSAGRPHVETALKACADPDMVDSGSGCTSLIMASCLGLTDVARALLESTACANLAQDDGVSALFMASQHGHLEIVRELCSVKANVNNVLPDEGTSPLFMAAQNGQLATVELLMDAKADPDLSTSEGATALHIAAQKGHLEIVQHLDNKGADKDIAAVDGAKPLFSAARVGHVDVVRHLLEVGANHTRRPTSGASPLFVACQEGHLEVARLLCAQAWAEVECTMPDGSTPFLVSCCEGHEDIVQLLAEQRARVNATLNSDATACFLAAQEGHLSIVRCLCESIGCDNDFATCWGASP